MIILIDNGHGSQTPGKQSPDGRLREYQWTRIAARRLAERLEALGYDARLVTPEDGDIMLSTRVRRVNEVCREHGRDNVALISLHVNAAVGDGWQRASGWSGWVSSKGASAGSRRLAALLYCEAEARGLKGDRCVPSSLCWEGNFAIVRDTLCPAVLTENLFMTNKEEVDYLLSDEGLATIVDLHVEAIVKAYPLCVCQQLR